MREIKFRVRDTKNNKWVDAVPSLEYLLDYGDHSISHHDIDEESGIYTYPKNITGDTFDGRLVWQQYTGLKDKNGKEIYEGDIVKTADGVSKLDVEFAKYTHGEVKWLREGFEVCQEHVGATRLSVFSKCDCCPADLEIISNIYETPELLTQ